MISSTIPSDRAIRSDFLPSTASAPVRESADRLDKISTENAAFLRMQLQKQPAVRAEVIARAKALAADPNYPPVEVMRKVAEQILNSPDLSEDMS